MSRNLSNRSVASKRRSSRTSYNGNGSLYDVTKSGVSRAGANRAIEGQRNNPERNAYTTQQ